MQLKIGDKVYFENTEYKITQELMGVYWGRKKYAREDTELPIEKLTLIESSNEKDCKLTREERGKILKDLVESASLRENFQREIIILSKLIKKFPHKEFWLEGFKPALKVDSLSYWYNRPEVEQLYKKWSLDLTTKTEEIKLEEIKVGEDIASQGKRPKTLLDILS